MLETLVVVCVIAAVSIGCWISAELSLAECESELRATREDLAIALQWDAPDESRAAVVLHAIDGGRS